MKTKQYATISDENVSRNCWSKILFSGNIVFSLFSVFENMTVFYATSKTWTQILDPDPKKPGP